MSNARGNQSIIASHPPIIEKQRGHGTSKWTAPLRVYSWREDKTSPHIQEIAFDLLQELGITRVYTVYPDKYPIQYPLLSLIHYEHHEIFPMKSQNPNRKDDEQLNSWDAFLFAFNNFGCIDMIKKIIPHRGFYHESSSVPGLRGKLTGKPLVSNRSIPSFSLDSPSINSGKISIMWQTPKVDHSSPDISLKWLV